MDTVKNLKKRESLPYQGDHNESFEHLLKTISGYDNCRITSQDHSSLQIAARKSFAIYDQIDFTFNDEDERIYMRSRLHIGSHDLGKGKKWLKLIKKRYLNNSESFEYGLAW
ncbi:MAG: DUF1499 domain-containing protein [Spirochaetes bacterium]|nr:DUF1499 domain-containing protein [Spirochaetota bacterium]MBN2771662.1 DUF1499 domain-containing protein [Spirochaetota bacterium]